MDLPLVLIELIYNYANGKDKVNIMFITGLIDEQQYWRMFSSATWPGCTPAVNKSAYNYRIQRNSDILNVDIDDLRVRKTWDVDNKYAIVENKKIPRLKCIILMHADDTILTSMGVLSAINILGAIEIDSHIIVVTEKYFTVWSNSCCVFKNKHSKKPLKGWNVSIGIYFTAFTKGNRVMLYKNNSTGFNNFTRRIQITRRDASNSRTVWYSSRYLYYTARIDNLSRVHALLKLW